MDIWTVSVSIIFPISNPQLFPEASSYCDTCSTKILQGSLCDVWWRPSQASVWVCVQAQPWSVVLWERARLDLSECPAQSSLAFIACDHLRDVKLNESANSPIWCRREKKDPGIIYSTIIKSFVLNSKGKWVFPFVFYISYSYSE